MNNRFLKLCVAILALALSTFAQGRVDERGHYIPTMEEIESNKRMAEILRHPSLINLRLVSTRGSEDEQPPSDTPMLYQLAEQVDFQLILSHSFSEALTIWQSLDPRYDLRPELFKDGALLPYSEEAQKYVDRADKDTAGSHAPSSLLHGKEYKMEIVKLKDWYGRLGAAHYQLALRRRFVWGGDWVQSTSVRFDVR